MTGHNALEKLKRGVRHFQAEVYSKHAAEYRRAAAKGQKPHTLFVACAGSRDKAEVLLPGGHVSLVAGPSAVKRMWPKLDQWLGRRST